jgi:hypothetical protein
MSRTVRRCVGQRARRGSSTMARTARPGWTRPPARRCSGGPSRPERPSPATSYRPASRLLHAQRQRGAFLVGPRGPSRRRTGVARPGRRRLRVHRRAGRRGAGRRGGRGPHSRPPDRAGRYDQLWRFLVRGLDRRPRLRLACRGRPAPGRYGLGSGRPGPRHAWRAASFRRGRAVGALGRPAQDHPMTPNEENLRCDIVSAMQEMDARGLNHLRQCLGPLRRRHENHAQRRPRHRPVARAGRRHANRPGAAGRGAAAVERVANVRRPL